MMQKQMDERTLGRKALVIVWPTLEDSRFIERNKSLYKRSLIRAFRVPEKHLSPATRGHIDRCYHPIYQLRVVA